MPSFLGSLFDDPKKLQALSGFLLSFGQGTLAAGQRGAGTVAGLGQGFASGGHGVIQALQQQKLDEMRALQRQALEQQIAARTAAARNQEGLAAIFQKSPDQLFAGGIQGLGAGPSALPNVAGGGLGPGASSGQIQAAIAPFAPQTAAASALAGARNREGQAFTAEQNRLTRAAGDRRLATQITAADKRAEATARGAETRALALEKRFTRSEKRKAKGAEATAKLAAETARATRESRKTAVDQRNRSYNRQLRLDAEKRVKEANAAKGLDKKSVAQINSQNRGIDTLLAGEKSLLQATESLGVGGAVGETLRRLPGGDFALKSILGVDPKKITTQRQAIRLFRENVIKTLRKSGRVPVQEQARILALLPSTGVFDTPERASDAIKAVFTEMRKIREGNSTFLSRGQKRLRFDGKGNLIQ